MAAGPQSAHKQPYAATGSTQETTTQSYVLNLHQYNNIRRNGIGHFELYHQDNIAFF